VHISADSNSCALYTQKILTYCKYIYLHSTCTCIFPLQLHMQTCAHTHVNRTHKSQTQATHIHKSLTHMIREHVLYIYIPYTCIFSVPSVYGIKTPSSIHSDIVIVFRRLMWSKSDIKKSETIFYIGKEY
jgi:hypothetical protein